LNNLLLALQSRNLNMLFVKVTQCFQFVLILPKRKKLLI